MMKTCRKAGHQYDCSKKTCPYCKKIADAVSNAKRLKKPIPTVFNFDPPKEEIDIDKTLDEASWDIKAWVQSI